MTAWVLIQLAAWAQEAPSDVRVERWEQCGRTLVAHRATVERGRALSAHPLLDEAELAEVHALVEQAPACAAAHALLARHSWGMARVQASQRAQALAPEDPDLMVQLSAALWAMGRKTEALAWLERSGTGTELDQLPRVGADVTVGPPAEPSTIDDSEVAEEIVVWGSAREERLALERELQEIGYGPGRRKRNGSTTFAPVNAQRPGLTIHEDGRFEVQSSGVVPTARVPGRPELGTVLRIAGRRTLLAGRTEVVAAVEERLRSWRAAVATERFDAAVEGRVSAELQAIWTDGTDRDGATLPDAPSRRRALLDYWATRACNEAGETVRMLVNAFLVDVVQTSSTPLEPGEVTAAEEAQVCGVPLQLVEE